MYILIQSETHIVLIYRVAGWPTLKNGTVDTVDFSELCSDQQSSFFTLPDRASSSSLLITGLFQQDHQIWLRTFYFMSNFLLVIHGLSHTFSGFARFPEFRGTINDKLMANPENDSP